MQITECFECTDWFEDDEAYCRCCWQKAQRRINELEQEVQVLKEKTGGSNGKDKID